MKDLKYIIKKILIGVGIAIILMGIKGSLIGNVYAANDDVIFNVPNSSNLYNYDGLVYSNFDKYTSGSYDEAIPAISTYKTMVYSSNYGNNGVKTLIGNINSNFTLEPMDSYSYYTFYGIKINFNETGLYWKLKKDTDYQVVLKFHKHKNLSYYDESFNQDHVLNTYIYDLDNENPVNADTFITSSFEWKIIPDEEDLTKQSQYAFLIINFRFNSEDWFEDFDNFSLQSMTITPPSGYHMTRDSPRAFITNKTNSNLGYKISYLTFLENGSISIGGVDTGSSGGSHSSGGGRHDNLDVVHESDMVVFNDLELCSSTDIACHVRNIISTIKNTFIRLGNGISELISTVSNIVNELIDKIKSLFIPSSEYLENFTTQNKNLFHNKLGILVYPFELISNVLNNFLNLQRNSVISFNGLTLPVFDKQIIPPFTFDFDTYLKSNDFITFYNYYLIVMNAVIIFMFFNLCVNKFKSISGGGN